MFRNLRWSVGKRFPAFFITSIFVIQGFLGMPAYSQEPDGKELFTVCKACHSIGKGKLIGPDLYGVNERHSEEWLIRFIRNSQEVIQSGDPAAVKIWEEYNKIPMPPNDMTDEEILAILDYIENYDADAEQAAAAAPAEPADKHGEKVSEDWFTEGDGMIRDYFTTLMVSLALMAVALFDLFVTRIVKARFVHLIIILISLAVITEITVVEAQNLGRQPGYEPDQPVLFSHKIHAGINQTDCQYCHTTVTESKHAGIPTVQVCMNCHNVVREGRHSGTEEIAKIYKAVEEGKPIEWIRVHNLPDHAYFSHAQHVGAGKLDCTECHGDVANMHRVRQVQTLSMGWCIECHRTKEVQFKENKFYQEYTKLQEELKSGQRTRVTVDDIGGTECAQCHY
jgi:mono/diheme cytochrome c family protein